MKIFPESANLRLRAIPYDERVAGTAEARACLQAMHDHLRRTHPGCAIIYERNRLAMAEALGNAILDHLLNLQRSQSTRRSFERLTNEEERACEDLRAAIWEDVLNDGVLSTHYWRLRDLVESVRIRQSGSLTLGNTREVCLAIFRDILQESIRE